MAIGGIMAARERYTAKALCPKCKQAGTIRVSEDDHPYIQDPHTAIDSVEGDFKAVVEGKGRISIECKRCGEHFPL